MKIKWRQHELLFFTIVALANIAVYLWDWATLTPQQLEGGYVIPYNAYNLHFVYYKNMSLPRIGVVILLYLCYVWVNRGVVYLIKKISLQAPTAIIIGKISLVIGQFFLISFLLALGINTATYFAHPYIFNYGGFQFFALGGYNDHPLQDLFFGFRRAVSVIGWLCLLGILRELAIYYLERPKGSKNYRALITNQFTIFASVYFSVAAIAILSMHFEQAPLFWHIYLTVVPPTFIMFMVNTYWIFPSIQQKSLFHYTTFAKVVLLTFVCTFPFFLLKGIEIPHDDFINFLNCWAFQLFITTPVSWQIYKQRKDRILLLRGIEKELEKSKANLQFLRSQINPHFLFNALNTLYGTALQEGSERTAEGIQMLGDMMRFMLHENNQDFIPMVKEIAYMQNYIALQKLRIQSSPNIIIDDNLEMQQCNHSIAPMLLLPLVENAFKHGISLTDKSWIKIELQCDEKNIRFTVYNSCHARTGTDPERDKSGLGLKNVKERLGLLYPNKHTFKANEQRDEFVAEITIEY